MVRALLHDAKNTIYIEELISNDFGTCIMYMHGT